MRFTCTNEASARAYGRLVAERVEGIRAHEPKTLVAAVHTFQGQPLQRMGAWERNDRPYVGL